VFEQKARNTVAHASYEKIRRHELLGCFHKLGSTFLSEEELCNINRYNILKLVIIKINIPYLPEYTTGLKMAVFWNVAPCSLVLIPEDSHLHTCCCENLRSYIRQGLLPIWCLKNEGPSYNHK
jgi:hypothetical protein